MEREMDCWALTCAGHAQVTLCELCERAPAVVTCRADAATLCATCDADIHSANRLARRHERVPVAPSSHDSAAAAAWQEGMDPGAVLGFYDPFLDLEYADGLVPIGGGGTPPAMMDFATGKPAFDSYIDGHLMSHCISSSEIGLVPDAASTTSIADVSNPYSHPIRSSNPTAAMDREARVMRYREKRKNRKFAKTIRYASRKAYAESRPRVKGRFVKRVEADSDADLVYSLGDNGYGVVPSF